MGDPEALVAPPPATGTGTSTGTANLTVSSVTGHIWVPSTVTGTGVPAGTIITAGPASGGAGVYTTSVNTTLTAIALTFTPSSTTPVFPDFVPPSPPVAAGNPPPPAFPPPSIPVPKGPLGGPVFSAGGISPVTTSGTNVITWPGFRTTFPVPTFVFSNVWTVPTISGGVWTTHLPAYTSTTLCVSSGGWGLPGPTGSGPGPPSSPNPPGAGLPAMVVNGGFAVAEPTWEGWPNGMPQSLSAAATPRKRGRPRKEA